MTNRSVLPHCSTIPVLLLAVLAFLCAPSAQSAGVLTEKDIIITRNPASTRVDIRLPEAVDVRVVDEIASHHYFFVDLYLTEAGFPDKTIKIDDGILKGIQTLSYPDLKVLRVIFLPSHATTFRVADLASGYVYRTTPANARSLDADRRHKARRVVVDTVKFKHHPLPPLLETAPPPPKPAAAALAAASPLGKTKRLVVIDPGHGGEDGGAESLEAVNGRKLYEKDLVLSVSKELCRLLNNTPNIQAVLTRNRDVTMGLRERVRFTEKLQADLFISVHANAGRFHKKSKTARGIEFYYLSTKSAPELRALEEAENLAQEESLDAEANSQWDMIARNLIKEEWDAHRAMGAQAADHLAQSFSKDAYYRLFNRGVKSAAFRVLMNRVTPCVLVEVGFIDHPREVVSLANRDFQKRIAKRIGNGVMRHFAQLDAEFQYYQFQMD